MGLLQKILAKYQYANIEDAIYDTAILDAQLENILIAAVIDKLK